MTARVIALAAVVTIGGCGGGKHTGGGAAGRTHTAPPSARVAYPPLPARLRPGERVAAKSGCLACHRIRGAGNLGPGPDLSRIGARLDRARIARILVDPPPPMPSFSRLRERRPRGFRQLVAFLAGLK